jgi:hypothetical protein
MEEIYFYYIILAYCLFTIISSSLGLSMLNEIPKQTSTSGTFVVPGESTTDPVTGITITQPDKTTKYNTKNNPYSLNNPLYYNSILFLSFSIAINALIIMYCIFKIIILYNQ